MKLSKMTSEPMNHKEVLKSTLALRKQQHRDLDDAISALHEKQHNDALTLQRLKRQKLALKDEIRRLEDEITPDIIA